MWLGGGVVAKVTGDRWAMGGTGLRAWNDEEAEEWSEEAMAGPPT
jgi:hypothetical protein